MNCKNSENATREGTMVNSQQTPVTHNTNVFHPTVSGSNQQQQQQQQQQHTIRSVDALDFLAREELLEKFVAFLVEKQYTLLSLYSLVEKPYKYTDTLNEFLQLVVPGFRVIEGY